MIPNSEIGIGIIRRIVPEAAVRRCSYMFLKIAQYSQENTCVEVSF